jgi:monofunctional glycosyltransferase
MPEGMSPAAAKVKARPLPRYRGWLKLAQRAVLVLVLLPIVLVPVYLVVPPVSTLMVYTGVFAGPIARDWVSLDEIAPSLVGAVVMSEDSQFCNHWGVDWNELNKVLDREGEPSRGASTIPMQTVKNLFLWTSRSYVRKALEIPLALYADLVWPKRRMMEIYLNVAEFGPGIFGAEAAAQRYFGKSAKALTQTQAALLAVTLPNPAERNPAKPTRFMRNRAAVIASRARAGGEYVACIYPK